MKNKIQKTNNTSKGNLTMKTLKIIAVLISLIILLYGCSAGNKDYVKERAEGIWKQQGFTVVGYEGYQWGFWGFNSYGGAHVWYRINKIPYNGITYEGTLQRWGNEIHVYNLKAVEGTLIQQTAQIDTTR